MKYCSLIYSSLWPLAKQVIPWRPARVPAFQLNVERWQPTASDLQFECTGGQMKSAEHALLVSEERLPRTILK